MSCGVLPLEGDTLEVVELVWLCVPYNNSIMSCGVLPLEGDTLEVVELVWLCVPYNDSIVYTNLL